MSKEKFDPTSSQDVAAELHEMAEVACDNGISEDLGFEGNGLIGSYSEDGTLIATWHFTVIAERVEVDYA